MLRLSLKYIRFFKEQSLYVLLGIVVTVAILTSVNSAFEVNNRMALEGAREVSGDYHFWYNKLSKEKVDTAFGLKEQCQIEKLGYLYSGEVYSALENPMTVGLKAADPGYREMFGFELLAGRYPEKKGEIALEEYVLAYFTDEGLGTQIQLTLDGKTDTYTVVGILEDMESEYTKGFGQKWGYVSENEIKDGYYQFFVKFNEHKNILQFQKDFNKRLGIEKDPSPNRDILLKVDYQTFIGQEEYINLSSSADEGGEEYGVLFKEWLAGKGLDKTLGMTFATLFSMVILYSIFQISVQQRIREYGKMQAFGIERKDMMILLGGELFLLFLVGFPLGTLSGAAIVWGIYQYFNESGAIAFSFSFSEVLSWEEILRNIGVFLLVLLLIVCVVTFQLSRMNVMETIRGEKEDRKKRRFFGFRKKGSRIWSKKTDVMMPVVLFKQFLEKKGRGITMILMLAVGGTVFLIGSYLEGQTIRNNRLTQMTNNGTNADIRVGIENVRFSNDIQEQQVTQMKELPEVRLVEPVGFYLGGILLKKDQIKDGFTENSYWKTQDKYYNTIFADMGGTLTEESPGNYNLKSEIYGYDDAMLEDLKDFVLDGDIDSVRQKDTIIFQTVMNGVGDWDILKLRAGDQITIRFPKESIGWVTDENQQILGMVPEGKYAYAYEEKTFTIGAVVKGGIADNQEFLSGGYTADAGIIMPNDRFHEIFDADGYNMVSVQLKDKKTADEAARKIRSITKVIEGISVIDFTDEIVRNQEYLDQTMILVRIIVLLLLAIGFFNTISSVNYMLFEKRKEFVVMRAMGITDVQLTRTMFGEGVVYGVVVSVLMIVFTLLVQIPVKYFLDHGFVYLNAQYTFNWPLAFLVAGVNILLCVIAVILPAKRILFHEITEELSDI